MLKVNHDKNIELSQQNAEMELHSHKHQRQLIRLKKNFNVFIEIYADSIAMHTQDNSGHSYRIGAQARYLAAQLGCNPLEGYRVYVAGLLYETGKLSLPQTLLSSPFDQLSPQQQITYNQFYRQSSRMLGRVGQLGDVVKVIDQIAQPFTQQEQTGADDLTLGARILAVIIAFDELILGRKTALRMSVRQAQASIEAQSPSHFDPLIVKLFFDMVQARPLSDDPHLEFAVDLAQLTDKLVLAKDVEDCRHGVLLTKGSVLKSSYVEQLTKVAKDQPQPLLIFVKQLANSDVQA